MGDPKQIYLAPYCECSDDRQWCEHDLHGDWCHCDECPDKPSVRYVRADIAEADQRRLEWLVANAPSYHGFIYDLLRGCGDNWRDAIDEAMEGEHVAE